MDAELTEPMEHSADVVPLRQEVGAAHLGQEVEPAAWWLLGVVVRSALASRAEEDALERWMPLVLGEATARRAVESEPWPSLESHWTSLDSPEKWILEAALLPHPDGSAR